MKINFEKVLIRCGKPALSYYCFTRRVPFSSHLNSTITVFSIAYNEVVSVNKLIVNPR